MATDPYAEIAKPLNDDPYAAIASPASTAAKPTPQPSTMQKIGGFAKDAAKGLGESAVSLMSTGNEQARKIPGIGEWLTTPITGTPADKAIAHTNELAKPANTTQAVSKGIGDAAQFLIPGGAEEKAVSLLPKIARPMGRLAASALSSGLVNKAQGGDFSTGAAAGGIGAGIGAGLKAAAPAIAEAAIGLPKAARAFGKTPGKALLEETRGIRPETIAESARGRLGQLNPELEQAAAQSTEPFNLDPARNVVSGEMTKAQTQNAASLHSQLGKQSDFLNKDFQTGNTIPTQVTPSEGLNLKRGFNEEHLRWNPEMHDRALSTGRRAYGALDAELDRTVPEAAGLNQRISSLIPVAQRAESVSRNAPTVQRALGRFGAHTGALTLGGIGAYEGRREGGIPGAIAGGLTGVLAPELVASPESQMIAARILNKSGTLRPIVGAGLQADRKKGEK